MQLYKVFLTLLVSLVVSSCVFAQSLVEPGNNHLQVIDKRAPVHKAAKLSAGTNKGMADKVLSKALSTYFDKAKAGKSDNKLLMILYGFTISKSSGIGILAINADFFSGQDDQFMYLGTVDSLYILSSKWDVQKDFASRIENKVSALLSYYAQMAAQGNELYTFSEAGSKRIDEKKDIPVYSTAPDFKKGIYFTVEQFLNNQPVDTPFYIKDPNASPKGLLVYYPAKNVADIKAVIPNTFFAAYDGVRWVIGGESTYSIMEFIEGEFYANRVVKLNHQTSTADAIMIGASTIVYGPLAGLMTLAATASELKEWTSVPCKFDPFTKKFMPIGIGKY